MSDQNLTLALLRHHAIAVVIGVILAIASRLKLTGNPSVVEILPTGYGLMAFCCIGGGITGLISGWQRRRAIRYYLGLTTLAFGVIWVVPFPH